MKTTNDFKQRAKNLVNLVDTFKVLDAVMTENISTVLGFNLMEVYHEGYLAGKEDALKILQENLSSDIKKQKGE